MILDFIKDIETHTYRRRLGNRIINFKMDVESPKYVHTYVRYGTSILKFLFTPLIRNIAKIITYASEK